MKMLDQLNALADSYMFDVKKSFHDASNIQVSYGALNVNAQQVRMKFSENIISNAPPGFSDNFTHKLSLGTNKKFRGYRSFNGSIIHACLAP